MGTDTVAGAADFLPTNKGNRGRLLARAVAAPEAKYGSIAAPVGATGATAAAAAFALAALSALILAFKAFLDK